MINENKRMAKNKVFVTNSSVNHRRSFHHSPNFRFFENEIKIENGEGMIQGSFFTKDKHPRFRKGKAGRKAMN